MYIHAPHDLHVNAPHVIHMYMPHTYIMDMPLPPCSQEHMKGLLALDGDLEDLNGWGQLLIKDCVTPDGEVIQERMDSLKARCDALGASGVERETALEESMLSLGQFEGAYDDMWEWLAGTVRKLEEFEPIAGDPDAVAVLLAKHKVRPWCCCSSSCCCYVSVAVVVVVMCL